MQKIARIAVPLLFLAVVALGAWQGQNVRKMREAEAFYRWIFAAATQERMAWGAVSLDSKDTELYKRVAETLDAQLPDEPLPAETQTQGPVSKLGRAAANQGNDKLIWQLARSAQAQPLRADFLQFCRERKLEFAKDIMYAEAQERGVSIFNLFFGFRKIAANLLWLEVDRYWHGGYLFRMVPMMRTVVALDPNFVDAYLLGAWHVAYNATAQMMDTPPSLRKWHPLYKACVGEKETYYHLAADFLKDGIRKNPRSYKLYFDLGFAVYKEKLHDYPNAVKYLAEALRQPHERWVPRQLYLCMEKNGQIEEALAGWQSYAEQFKGTGGGDDVAPRFIARNRGLLFEKRWKEALAKVKTAATPEDAAKAQAEAKESRDRAIEVWTGMKDENFAQAHLMRIQAMDLREAGRYYEAIAKLDQARWAVGEFFEEGSDLIIDIKQQANIPLSVSEQKAVMRRSETGTCEGDTKAAEGEAGTAAEGAAS